MKTLVFRTLILVVLFAVIGSAAPKPAIVQGPKLWTANVEFEPLRQIMYQPTEHAKPRRFWYTIITIANHTKQDIEFYPQCDLMTETFQILPAGKLVPPEIFHMIKARHNSQYPLLESLRAVGSRILQGEDNARDIAIVWSDFDPKAKNVKLFISGLSNETAILRFPSADASIPEKTAFLRKTLELNYHLKGDSVWRADEDIAFKGKNWIMR
jgi:hypothetical protein